MHRKLHTLCSLQPNVRQLILVTQKDLTKHIPPAKPHKLSYKFSANVEDLIEIVLLLQIIVSSVTFSVHSHCNKNTSGCMLVIAFYCTCWPTLSFLMFDLNAVHCLSCQYLHYHPTLPRLYSTSKSSHQCNASDHLPFQSAHRSCFVCSAVIGIGILSFVIRALFVCLALIHPVLLQCPLHLNLHLLGGIISISIFYSLFDWMKIWILIYVDPFVQAKWFAVSPYFSLPFHW